MTKQTSPLKTADLPLPSNTYKGATLARGLHNFMLVNVGLAVLITAVSWGKPGDTFAVNLMVSALAWIVPGFVISTFTRVIADTICAIFDIRQIALHMAVRMDERVEANQPDEGLER